MNVRISTSRFRAWFPAQGTAPPGTRQFPEIRSETEEAQVLPPHVQVQSSSADTMSAQAVPANAVQADLEEQRWLVLARQGDVAAFEWLMNRYRDRAVRLAAYTLRRPAEAEDLVQEAFVRAFAQISRFRGEAAFYSWLYKIVVRLCLNRMRQPHWFREWEPAAEEETARELGGSGSSEQYADRLLIETLLDHLSPPLRAALVLREMEGMDYAEIAHALGIPVGTVRSRLNAARQQFRVLWERAMKEAANV